MKDRELENISYVVCKICGKRGRIITNHLYKKHGLTRKQYENAYHSPAVCYERQLIQIERNKLLNNELSTNPYYIDLMEKVRHANGCLPQVKEALQNGHIRYLSSDEGKVNNSKIMRYLHDSRDIQKLATAGKLKSKKFHDQKSRQISEMNKQRFSDEEYKARFIYEKLFNGSKKEYIAYDGSTVFLRSSWELQVFNYLNLNHISYEYESIRIIYVSTDNKEHTYIPDFYLIDYNLILEIKPQMYVTNKINQIKKKVSLDAGYKFMFVTEKQLKDLNSFFHNLLNGS